MRTRFAAVFAALALLTVQACGPQAPAAAGSAEDEQAVRELAGKWAAAYSQRDTAAFGPLVTDDYEDVAPTGEHTQGRAAFQAMLAREFAMMPANAQMSLSATTTFVRWINADAAITGGTWQASPGTPGMPSKGSWMGVAVRRGTTWQMQSVLGAADLSAMMAQDTAKKTP